MILGKLNIPVITGGGSTLKNNLIACWELDETSGTTAYDSNGSNNCSINGATINQAGKIGQCYSFDGANDRLVSGLTGNMAAFTISTWINHNFSTSGGYDRIIGKQRDSPSPYQYFAIQQEATGNTIGFYALNTAGGFSKAISTTSLTAGTWYHLVATFNGTVAKIYINGTNEHTGATFTGTRNYNSNPILIGMSINGSGGETMALKAKLDQDSIWDRVLTAAEITSLYNSGNGLAYTNW
jgi:hypothetical protein